MNKLTQKQKDSVGEIMNFYFHVMQKGSAAIDIDKMNDLLLLQKDDEALFEFCNDMHLITMHFMKKANI